jgi:hypothetical protein
MCQDLFPVVKKVELGFNITDCNLAIYYLSCEMARHGEKRLVIRGAVPGINRVVDIFQAKTPGSGKQAGIPVQISQVGTKPFHLRLDTYYPHFRNGNLFFVRLGSGSNSSINICGRISRTTVVKHHLNNWLAA